MHFFMRNVYFVLWPRREDKRPECETDVFAAAPRYALYFDDNRHINYPGS
jgi:hypothetical protein